MHSYRSNYFNLFVIHMNTYMHLQMQGDVVVTGSEQIYLCTCAPIFHQKNLCNSELSLT